MKIEIVQLENIRSHELSTVPFARGFNCLVGGVGSGKSSLLFAVDFALFGDPIGRSFEYLLREGADSGKITVQFVQNGKNYKICRGLRRRGKGIGQDFEVLKLFEDEAVIANMKNDAVIEQLKVITGLDKELFREIVWVRQEHLKQLLDAQPRERQRRLDELFGLSDYEEAWSNIAASQKGYEGEKRAYEKDPDVAGMETLSIEYNRVAEEFSLIQVQIEEVQRRLSSSKKALEETEFRLKKLEEKRSAVEELMRNEAKIATILANLESTSTSLADKAEGKKAIIKNLEQRLGSAQKQADSAKDELRQISISSDQSFDELRIYLATLDNQVASLKGEQEAASRAMRENQKRNIQLAAENRCPLCLQPLSDDYRKVLAQKILEDNSFNQKEISRLQHEIEELQQVKTKASVALTNMQTAKFKAGELSSRLSEESEQLASLSRELEEKRRLAIEAQAQVENIRIEIGKADLSELETAKTVREEVFKQYYLFQSELQTKKSRKADLEKRSEEIRERIDLAQQKIERMEQIAKLVEIISGIRDAYRNIQPKLRAEFVKALRNFVQQVLDSLVGDEGPFMNVLIDENYSPSIRSERNVEREVLHLSGGERTLLAFAYRMGLGQLIMQSRTGHGLSLLLLDEPTESLGIEDGSIERLAEAISRFKAIEQIIAVTHSEAFAEKAGHVVRLEKEAEVSKASVER